MKFIYLFIDQPTFKIASEKVKKKQQKIKAASMR
jgi:hypothetical protein